MRTHRSTAVAVACVATAVALAPVVAHAQRDTLSTRRDSARVLESVTISAIRSHRDAPISEKTLTTTEITRRSFGQDVPLLLQGTPSLTSYAETGNYWGYSYIRLRGIDQSRINLTLDGIPLNDPEDQVLYFTDFPDLSASISSIQIQRGVGTSAPGTASYGGSINFQTVPVATSPRAGEIQLQGGSFGSGRASAEYASGLSAGGLAVYARASALQSNGYRRHSGAEGRSGLLSAAYVRGNNVLKFTGLAGLFADTLAYIGASEAELTQDRRFNPLRSDEVDRFGEQVAALSYTRFLGGGGSSQTTVYRTSASGNYDVCVYQCDKNTADLWNFNLDFVWYGVTSVWSLERDRVRASVGVNANTYARDHYAYDRPNFTTPLYFNTGHKEDASAFAKLAYDVGAITLFGDLQGRHAAFRYDPDANSGITGSSIAWSFVNPKVGATLRVSPTATAYVSYGVNAREPARSDIFGGFDNLDTTNASFVGSFDGVRPERAHDVELGVHLTRGTVRLDANAFAMSFRDEILPIGQLSYIGTPLRKNVSASWRRGLEADVRAQPSGRVDLGLTLTLMAANIVSYTDDQSGQTYADVEPLLTPKFLASPRARFALTRELSAAVNGRYSSRAQLTNTGDPTLTLPPFFVTDVSIDWTRGTRGVSLFVNNALNRQGYASGHVVGGEPRFYVLPPLNLFLQARLGM